MATNHAAHKALAELRAQQDMVLRLRKELSKEEALLRELEHKYNKAVSDSSNWK